MNQAPYPPGDKGGDPHESLCWRFQNQTTIREGGWQYSHFEGNGFLRNVRSDDHEGRNLRSEHADRAMSRRTKLRFWASGLAAPGLNALERPRTADPDKSAHRATPANPTE